MYPFYCSSIKSSTCPYFARSGCIQINLQGFVQGLKSGGFVMYRHKTSLSFKFWRAFFHAKPVYEQTSRQLCGSSLRLGLFHRTSRYICPIDQGSSRCSLSLGAVNNDRSLCRVSIRLHFMISGLSRYICQRFICILSTQLRFVMNVFDKTD